MPYSGDNVGDHVEVLPGLPELTSLKESKMMPSMNDLDL
jgi:hypothetical protein